MGVRWTDEEKELAINCKSEDDLAIQYLKKFGTADRSRVHSLFGHRNDLIRARTVARTSPPIVHKAIFDEDVILAHISNKLSELIQLQKETLEIFKKLSEKKVE